ncbi:MAG TPA: PP2C family protein-serine/threonine phosphatase [Thermoanaerobaculia bacterium]|jgi:hypothetical protein
MPPKERTRWRDVAWYSPIAIVGGALIAAMSSGLHWNVRVLLHGGLIGLTCFSGAIFCESLVHRWVQAAPGQWWRRALVYFVGGQLGFPIGFALGVWLIWGQPISSLRLPRTVWITVLFTGGVGTFIGLVAHGYESMKDRLRTTIVAEKELELAREFQARLLPAPEIAADSYRITSRNLAARYVAGDFYDVFQYADGAVGVAIADVAGKGVAASLTMASVKAVLPLLAASRPVDEAMCALNEKFNGELPKREFIALALARYDPRTGSVSFANAGVPDPYVVRQNGEVETIVVGGPRLPLGLKRSIPYEKVTFSLRQGDALLLFSDGLPEATTPDGEQLGYDRLAQIVRDARGVDAILERVHAMTSEQVEDDQTIVMLERRRAS